MRGLSLAAALLAGLALAAQPAQACSFAWKPGYSPREIPHRDDVQRVRGDFVFTDAVTGQDVPNDSEFNLKDDEAFGVIKRKGRKPLLVRVYYSETLMTCGAYTGPTANGMGTFWLERRRDKDGRYRILLWRPG